MSVYNGKFNVQEFTNVVNITNDQTILTSNGEGFGPLSVSKTIGPVYNYASQTLKVNKIDANEYQNLPGATYTNTNYQSYPEFVGAFYELTDENNFTYDYTGNQFNLTNFGVVSTVNGTYFPLNNDIPGKATYVEYMRRFELSGDKLINLVSSINTEFSITFDIKPEETNSVLFSLATNTSIDNKIMLSYTPSGYFGLEIYINGVSVLSMVSPSPFPLNKDYHVSIVSRNGDIALYINNVSVGIQSYSLDISNQNYSILTIGCMKKVNENRYRLPFAGYIKSFMITRDSVNTTLRTEIFNDMYGYDIILLGGQSNMVGWDSIQDGYDNDYSEIVGKVFQYDFNTDTIIPATNQLKHYMMEGSTYSDRTGGWLNFSNQYIKYFKKSPSRKLLFVPCALGGSSFVYHWRPGMEMMENLILNSNKCVYASKLNKIIGLLWYQGESDLSASNLSYATDLENFRTELITKIDGFTDDTPIVMTLINDKQHYAININGIPGNEFINNCIINFCNKYDYKYADTGDLKLKDDDIHLNTQSLREIGLRWFDKFCECMKLDNKSKPIIYAEDIIKANKMIVENLEIKNLDLVYDTSYDVDIEKYLAFGRNETITTNSAMTVSKAFYQPKTDVIWLTTVNNNITFKYIDVKTNKLYNRTDWPNAPTNSLASCMYKDMLYVLNCEHYLSTPNGDKISLAVLYIIDTLNYTIETIKDFVVKTSNMESDWTVPSGSSSNVTIVKAATASYSGLFAYNDKLYFIPYAQMDIGIFDLKTKTFDQTTLNLGYNGGLYGGVYNPFNKCLYMSKCYKIGSSSPYDIPYIDFSTGTPVLNSITLPTNYVGFRNGCYCFSNNSVYISMGLDGDGGANNYLLKILPNNTTAQITFADNFMANKQFTSMLFAPNGKVLMNNFVNGESYSFNPTTDTLDSATPFFDIDARYMQVFDKYGNLYYFSSSSVNNFTRYKFPITINNKEIFNPTFNCQR